MSREVSAAMLRIMDEIDCIDAHEHTKRSLKAFINETCLAAGITVVDRRERILFARRLLDDGERRPTIRDRLMVRFSIKRASAYAVIDRALQLSSNHEKFWTNDEQTGTADTTHSRTANERFSER
jgi:hypothetical protein